MSETYHPKTTPWEINEHDFPREGPREEQLRFLLRYAILAPSSHNTQPWLFAIKDQTIQVFVDRSRWLQVADADQRELHISIGCAIENLLIAADYFGYGHQMRLFPEAGRDDLIAAITLLPAQQSTPQRDPSLFKAIPHRHTSRKNFEPDPIPADDLRRLEQSVAEDGITLFITDDQDIKQRVEELMTQGDIRQFADPAYREELGYWIGQGVFGSPWLLAKLGQFAITAINMGKGVARKDSEALMSAPAIAAMVSTVSDRPAQVRTGQAFVRVALTAASLGISLHPMSQPLELPDLKQELMALLPLAEAIPQHTFRLGYARPEADYSPRRPLQEVLV